MAETIEEEEEEEEEEEADETTTTTTTTTTTGGSSSGSSEWDNVGPGLFPSVATACLGAFLFGYHSAVISALWPIADDLGFAGDNVRKARWCPSSSREVRGRARDRTPG